METHRADAEPRTPSVFEVIGSDDGSDFREVASRKELPAECKICRAVPAFAD